MAVSKPAQQPTRSVAAEVDADDLNDLVFVGVRTIGRVLRVVPVVNAGRPGDLVVVDPRHPAFGLVMPALHRRDGTEFRGLVGL